ncbi:MAG: hypothetical protein EA385_14145 [Salinarimonadaceae bacterium]|nr:MAG: hypothetical protein EA385_14145 [Salinarimonadaceae bacterium]
MPHFEPHYAGKLLGGLGVADAEAVLDLREANPPQAEASLSDLFERSRFGPRRTVAVRLAPPPEGGGETLFQPVGRQLLEARKRGLVERLQPLPAHDGLGYFVALAGRPEKSEAQ